MTDLISQKIANGTYRTQKHQGSPNIIWSVLEDIIDEGDEILKQFVYCSKCLNVLRHNLKELRSHSCCSAMNSRGLGESIKNEIEEYQPKTEEYITEEKHLPEYSGGQFIITQMSTDFEQQTLEDSLLEKYLSKTEEYEDTSGTSIKNEPIDDDPLTMDTSNEENSNFIALQISKGVYTLSNKRKGKSLVWEIVAEILKEDKTILEGYVCCRKCHQVIPHRGSTTSSLHRHKCCADYKNLNAEEDEHYTDNDDNGEEFMNVKQSKAARKQSLLSSKTIGEMLRAGVYSIGESLQYRKSHWITMCSILKKDRSTLEGFVVCSKCHKVLRSYKASNLNRHIFNCQGFRKKRVVMQETVSHDISPTWSAEEEEDNSIEMMETQPCENKASKIMEACIVDKIDKGIFTISQRNPPRNSIWNVMAEIIQQNGLILENFLYCRKCKKTLKFNATQVANICQHSCWLAYKQQFPTVHWSDGEDLEEFNDPCFQYFHTCLVSNCKRYEGIVSTKDRMDTLKTCMAWTIQDFCPPSFMEGSGLARFAKFFIRMGARYGEDLAFADLLPKPSVIDEKLQKLSQETKFYLGKTLDEMVRSNGVAASIETWQDKNLQRTYMSVSLHYCRNEQIYNVFLGIKSLDSAFTYDICEELTSIFHEYGIVDIKDIKFVFDQESEDIKEALKDYKHLSSSSHLLCNLLDKAFEVNAKDLQIFLGECHGLYDFLKIYPISKKVEEQISNRCQKIKWYSNYKLLKAIMDNWSDIETFLTEDEHSQGVNKINPNDLKMLTDLLGNFDKIYQRLNDTATPSLCFVVPSINKLRKLCIAKENDIPCVVELKRNILKDLNEIWTKNLNIWHRVAFYLYPPAARLQKYNDLIEAQKFCTTAIENLKSSSGSRDPPPTASTTSSQAESNSTADFFFSDLLEDSDMDSRPDAINEEVCRYSTELVEISDNFDAIQWWTKNSLKYPYLSKFAFQVLAIPASSKVNDEIPKFAVSLSATTNKPVDANTLDSVTFLNSRHQDFLK